MHFSKHYNRPKGFSLSFGDFCTFQKIVSTKCRLLFLIVDRPCGFGMTRMYIANLVFLLEEDTIQVSKISYFPKKLKFFYSVDKFRQIFHFLCGILYL